MGEEGGGVRPAAEALGFCEGGGGVFGIVVVRVVERVVVRVGGWLGADALFRVEGVGGARVGEVVSAVHVVLLEGVAGFAEAADAFVIVCVGGGLEGAGVGGGGGGDHVFFIGVFV